MIDDVTTVSERSPVLQQGHDLKQHLKANSH